MKRKVLCLMLASLMVVSCFAGCGKTETETPAVEQSTEQQSTEEESAEASVEELEEKTIQIMLMGPGVQKDSDKVWSAFNEKLQEYVPNTSVEFIVVPAGEYKERFNQMLAAGEAVDAAWVGYASPSQDSLVSDGSLMPLNDLLDEHGQDIKTALGDRVLEISTYDDGELYYMVSWQGLFTQKRGYYIPKRFAELAGPTWAEDTQKLVSEYYAASADGYDLDLYQKIYDQFEIYLQAMKDNGLLNSGIEGFMNAPQIKNIDGWQMHKQSVGIAKGDNTFTVIDLIDTEHYKFYAEHMADWYQKGFIRSDIASIEQSSLAFLQKDNNGELTPNSLVWMTHNYFTESDLTTREAQYGEELIVIEIEDNGWLGRGQETSMAIPYCADEPERVMMVMNALYSKPDLYNILIYGIEGEHYTTNDDGTIVVADNFNTADSNYGLNKWYIGTCRNALVTQKDIPGMYDEFAKLEETAIISPFQKFVFDESAVVDVVAALKAIDGEYEAIIRQGYAEDWEATYEKWVAERKAAGVDQLITEYQKQIDAFVEKNNITSW